MKQKTSEYECLPDIAADYIRRVVKRAGRSRRTRRDVRRELIDHFIDALDDVPEGSKRDECAAELIKEFGEVKVLGRLIRRGKKRCRPLWKKSLIRALQATGLLLVCIALYAGWLLTGTPTIRVDYRDIANRQGMPADAAAANAYDDYQRAIALYVDATDEALWTALWSPDDSIRRLPLPSRIAKMSPETRAQMRAWIEANEPAWREGTAGSTRDHFWIEYRPDPEGKSMLHDWGVVPMPRGLVQLGEWRIAMALVDGNAQQAIDDCFVLARIGRHYHRAMIPSILQLGGFGCTMTADEGLLNLAATSLLNAADFAEVQARIEALHPNGYPQWSIEYDRLAMRDAIQRCFTEGGPGGGHLILHLFEREFELSNRDADDLTSGMLRHPLRDEVVRITERYFDLAAVRTNLSPFQRHVQGITDWDWQFRIDASVIIHVLIGTAWDDVSKCTFRARGQALHEATIAVLAIRRWQLERGEYPARLEQLVEASYLTRLPDDPYSAGSLIYTSRGAGFTLYSVGDDLTDNGGVPGTYGSRISLEPGTDLIVWPTQQP